MGNNRKIAALFGTAVLTASLLMQAGMPVMAAAGDVPSDTKTAQVSVSNIEDADTVTAYRVIKPVYNSEGFVKFEAVSGVNIADIENPTAAEVTAVSQAILNGTVSPDKVVEMTGSGTTYTGALPAGEYIVMVKDAANAKYIYNPMVVSAYFTDANEADSLTASDTLSADSDFTGGAYAKRTEIPLDKEITDADGVTIKDDDSDDGSQADDLGVGDTGTFTIRTQFPAWSDAYKAKGVKFTLTDNQDDGFDAPAKADIKVKVGGRNVTAAAASYTVTISGNDFTIEFNSDYALANAGKQIEVTYKAKLNANAAQKFDPNNDTVELKFTNDAYDKNDITTLTDDVQEYTFPVSIKKVGEENEALPGAEFTLTRTDAGNKTGTNTYTVATGTDGTSTFNRLDEGIYKVVETKAPTGFAINPDEFEVKIIPEYNTDGSLKNYKVTMKNTTKGTDVGSITVDNADADILAGNIMDTELQRLPSTGGEGRTALIAVSAALLVLTAVLITAANKTKKLSK